VDEGDRGFKAVIVALRIRGGGLGGVDVQHLGQLNRELLEVGALGPSRGFPARDEIVDDQWIAFGGNCANLFITRKPLARNTRLFLALSCWLRTIQRDQKNNWQFSAGLAIKSGKIFGKKQAK